MRRFSYPVLLALALAPMLARAQSDIHADVEARAEFTDNARVVSESGTKDADQIYVANPSIEGLLDTRGVRAEIRYSLSYYHYSKANDLDRALHDLDATAALVYWDALDLDVQQVLRPQAIDFARPIADPSNDVQASQSHAHLGFHHDFGRSTRAMAGVRGEYGTYFKVHKNDPELPTFTIIAPELRAERDVGPRTTVIALVRYAMESFATVKAPAPQPNDFTSAGGEVGVKATPTDWLAVEASGGGRSVTFKGNAGSTFVTDTNKTRAVARLGVAAGGEIGRVDLNLTHDVTQDVLGNPATVTRAGLGGSYSPTAPWNARASVGFGQIEYLYPGVAAAGAPKTNEGFIEGEAAAGYRISVGTLTLGVAHHESTSKVENVSGSAKVVVNRGFVGVGGRF